MAQPLHRGIRCYVEGSETTFELVNRAAVDDVRHGLGGSTDAPVWVVGITQGCRGYGDSHGDSNGDSCGYGMGMGIEMPSPRQPWYNPTDGDWLHIGQCLSGNVHKMIQLK